MPGLKSSRKRRADRLRSLPWAAALRVTFIVGRRVGSLSSRDRRRLGELMKQSRGWPGRLGDRERAELRKLVGKLDLRAMGRELARARGRRPRTLRGKGKRR
jgi:hypothetical protein